MLADYFYWQYVWAPHFLLQTIYNLQRALWRFFSVKHMLSTLFAHWHKDAVPYHGGTISKLTLALIWNIVSRLFGFTIRLSVIITWFFTEAVYLPLAAVIFFLFLVWPIITLAGLVFGVYGLLL